MTNVADKEENLIEKITRESLKNLKGFQKLLKKQAKDKENLKKKHNKDRALMQKQHSGVIDKMTANYYKTNQNTLGSNIVANSNGKLMDKSKNETENTFKAKMKDIVQEQSRLWANLIEKQQNEEKQLNNEHLDQQCNQLIQLLFETQKQRKKDLESRQKKETEQLKANQARQSVEDSKRLLSDKNFRNKQDRDRRLRELNSNNMKRFIDERKRLASKHKQDNEMLENITKEEEEFLREENRKAKDLAASINEELTYSLNPSAVC